MRWNLYISEQADSEIDEIWQWGYDHFGLQIADDYDVLIKQAFYDLKHDPYRLGAYRVKGRKDELYSYHLMYSNNRAQGNIKHPAHTVYYFIIEEKTIAIVSIARDQRETHIAHIDRGVIIQEMKADNRQRTDALRPQHRVASLSSISCREVHRET